MAFLFWSCGAGCRPHSTSSGQALRDCFVGFPHRVRGDHPTLRKEREGWGTRRLAAGIELKAPSVGAHRGPVWHPGDCGGMAPKRGSGHDFCHALRRSRNSGLGYWGFYRFYGDETAGPAAVDEVHLTCNLGVEGVVFAPAYVQTGLQFGAALTDDDGTTSDDLASKDLYTQSLSVGIAAVFRTA